MDIKEIKLQLKAISLIDQINNKRQEEIKRNAEKLKQDEPLTLGEQVLLDLKNKYYTHCINRDTAYKKRLLELLDLSASERDKDLLYRKYVSGQELFDIAEDLFYSFGHTERLILAAEKRLLERINQKEKGNK